MTAVETTTSTASPSIPVATADNTAGPTSTMSTASEDREGRRTTRGTGAPGKTISEDATAFAITFEKETSLPTAPSETMPPALVEEITVKRSDSALPSEEDQLESADDEAGEMEVDSAEVEENGGHASGDEAGEGDELQNGRESAEGEVGGKRLVELFFD